MGNPGYSWNGNSNPGPPGHGCFSERMEITTDNGFEPLGNIRPGAKVSSFDLKSGKMVMRRVYTKKVYENRKIWALKVDGLSNTIETTAHHPFLTPRGWVTAQSLRKDDRLLGVNEQGLIHRYNILSSSNSGERQTVVNLITANEHTFMVNGLIVHNYSWARSIRSLLSETWAALGGYETGERKPAGVLQVS